MKRATPPPMEKSTFGKRWVEECVLKLFSIKGTTLENGRGAYSSESKIPY